VKIVKFYVQGELGVVASKATEMDVLIPVPVLFPNQYEARNNDGTGRTAVTQAFFQLLALLVALCE